MSAAVFSRAASGVVILAVLAAAPLRAQQHGHPADSTHADSAKKKPSAMPMNMPGMGGATKKPAARKAARKPPKAAADKPKADSTSIRRSRDSATIRMPQMPPDSAATRKPMKAADSTTMQMPHDSAPAHMPMVDSAAHPAMPGMDRDSTSGAGIPMGQASGMTMMTGALGIPMDRMGSGTTWIPDAVRLPSRHIPARGWDVMVHGFVFGQYDAQGGPRGDRQLGSLNWGMLMATHEVAGGIFQARTMLSLDAATVGGRGYPLLLQSGEAYAGQPLHDRQHPHDLFMELGAIYERAVTSDVAWSLYVAPSGEPALGPVAFMHRPSAMDIPTANITHHWQDATHISFGVVTGGVFTRWAKLEGSVFNGREPDEHRWNFDPIRLDSYSARLTVNPGAHWSMAAGYGYLESPEALHPDESMHRITASVLHGTALGSAGQWSTAVIWGANRHSTTPGLTHGALVESEAILDTHNTVFGRVEYVQKSGEDLVVDDQGTLPPGSAPFATNRIFNVGALALGYIREVGRWKWATIGIGAQGSVNVVPSALEGVYGSRAPVGGLVFVRLRPFHAGGSEMAPMDGGANAAHRGHD